MKMKTDSRGPKIIYQELIDGGELISDLNQESVVGYFDRLYTHILNETSVPKSSFIGRFFRPSNKYRDIRGIYLWGSVGRGKTFLLDLFYNCIPIDRKQRVHYHKFMQDIHKEINLTKVSGNNNPDPLENIILRISNKTRLLCFDEFQVTDIGDAMILGRLFDGLISSGVIIVITSNRAPDLLYHGGINRDRFMPFIETVKNKMNVIELSGDGDFRQLYLRQADLYMIPICEKNIDYLGATFSQLTGQSYFIPIEIEVQGRLLKVDKAAKGVAWFTFDELCGKPLGAADYLAVQSSFHTVLIEGVPQMGPEKRNEAKRFVTLIDVLYENMISLVIVADVRPEELYPKGTGNFEFDRTISRLNEMQSEEYLAHNYSFK